MVSGGGAVAAPLRRVSGPTPHAGRLARTHRRWDKRAADISAGLSSFWNILELWSRPTFSHLRT